MVLYAKTETYCWVCFLFHQESIVDEQENLKDENVHLRRFLRILANLLILCCLGGSGYLIYYVVKRSQGFAKLDRNELTWLQKNEVLLFLLPFNCLKKKKSETLFSLRSG